MAKQIGIGFSDEIDVIKAAKNAALDANLDIDKPSIDLMVIFATVQYDFSMIVPTIKSILDVKKIIGTSTSGIILASGIKTQGIGVLAISSDTMPFGISHINNIPSRDAYQAGFTLAKEALKDFGQDPRQAFIFFADGRLENSSMMLKGLQDILGNAFVIAGAGSCDDFHFQKSYQIFDDKVLHHSAVGLVLGGLPGIGIAGRHGWRPLGKPRKVTSSKHNIIHTINNQKASYIYKDYFQEDAKKLEHSQYDQLAILYPLGIFIDRKNEYLLRNAVNILPDGSILCQGDIPEGAEVHIMIGNKESCRQATINAAKEAKEKLMGEKAQLILVLESMARQKLFGRNAYKETEEIRKVFGESVPIIGMYTHGETYPFQDVKNMKKIHTQNESIVILAIK